MQATHEQQRKAMVVGLGKSGLSAARYLHAQGYSVAVTDSRIAPPGLEALRDALPNAAVFVGGFSDAALANADVVVVSPGIPLHDPFINHVRVTGVELLGDIELFARAATQPVVAVTGSNGKSTVATLFAVMAETAKRRVGLGGNVGTPALDLLLQDVDLYVLELSSFQLESTRSLAASAAVILNITPDHIDWHGSMESYAAAKARIYTNAKACVFNRDDEWTARLAENIHGAVSFGLSAPTRDEDFGTVEAGGNTWLVRGQEKLICTDELQLTGAHNHANALACLALGYAIKLPLEAMLIALREFTGLPHRMNHVAEQNGVVFVNDSKGTNIGATVAAIRGAGRPLVLIAGGDGKGQDFSELAVALRGNAHHIVLIGRDAKNIESAIAGAITVEHAGDMRSAVRKAAAAAQVGDMVLLSPACSSLDMFANYEARGDAFVQAVREVTA